MEGPGNHSRRDWHGWSLNAGRLLLALRLQTTHTATLGSMLRRSSKLSTVIPGPVRGSSGARQLPAWPTNPRMPVAPVHAH